MENNNEIQIQFVPIELLEYNDGQIPGVPENPRTREDSKQRNLEKSIEELPEMTIARAALCFPYKGRYVVIGGNRRLEAQRALKRKEVPIIALPENTPVEKLRRIALLDNESTGQTDWAKLAKDWNKDEIRAWNIETPKGWFNEAPGKKVKEDNYEEPEKLKSIVKPGEIWKLGEHRLMCGDSTKEENIKKLLNGERPGLLLTDPPYGIDYGGILKGKGNGKGGADKNGWKSYDAPDWDKERPTKDFFNLAFKYSENQIIWGGNYFADILPPRMCWLVWDKGQRDFSLADGELAWTSFNKALRINSYSRALANREEKIHPTQKPIEIIKWCIEIAERNKADTNIILDLFGGSGSTLITCEQLNKKNLTMEMDEHYCDLIINRWETLTGRKAVKIG